MIRIMERSTHGAIGFEMSGMVTLRELKKVTAYFKKAVSAHGTVNWLAVSRGLVVFTPTAFVHDLGFNIRNAKHFKKKAVVSDSFLLKLATNALGPLLGMKHFELKEIELAWYYVAS
jgi:Na+(H+)/acetate symporter ActP